MLPSLETSAAVAKIDRTLTLKRAERRALWLAAATLSQPTPTAVLVATAATQRRLARAVRSLWAVRRPVPA